MLHRNALAALLGLPLVIAALVASTTYAWATFTVDPDSVRADGAALQEKKGVAMFTVKVGDVEYVVVSSHSRNLNVKEEEPVSGENCHFLSFYQLTVKSDKETELRFVGSRCVEWDNGFDLVNFTKSRFGDPAEMRSKR
ncbi:MAG: hypothetical protein IT464_15695 [Planctomycetes bacterium]|nr:hypothetical protein [Planctomycetota bacterium]MCC7510807.1 hypothetical protein [Planctomycetota bacterium]